MMIRRAFSAATGAATKGPRGTVSLFQIPVNLGQPFLGPDKAPKLLLESGLTDILAASGWGTKMMPVIDTTGFVEEKALSDWSNTRDGCHDVITRHAQSAKNIAEVGYVCEKAHKAIYEEAKTSNFILNLGGDHCIPIGTLSAIKSARPSLGVVWVDAHADINTPETSSSGNVHGMPVAFLMGLVGNESSYPSMQWFKPVLHPRDVVYIGLRDVDSGEKQFIKELGIKAYSMRDIDKYGIGKVMDEVNDYFRDRSDIHLSYDIDALDPFYAPSTGTAVRGGLTFREGNFICEELFASGRLTSMDLVEVNPDLHTLASERTIDVANVLIGSAMGNEILDRTIPVKR